jgi:hypothetical protein
MEEADTFTLEDDLPKKNPWKDDRLGFQPFAERLSEVIKSLRVPNGYVIGLHGEWGSGKTTALNFVKAFIEKHNQEAKSCGEHIHVIDFQPWIVSGHQDLIAAFFKIMSESLATRAGWCRRQINRVLRLFKITTDPLVDAIATVAVTVDPSAGVASRAVATVTKKSAGRMIDRFLADPSLQTAYEDLKGALDKRGKRFLVTIDDLDRLQHEEIRSIMQMVKTVGHLPNVVYLLAYDRTIVWRALDGDAVRIGPRFAEKIVQQEIELPQPSKNSLLSILDEEIDFLTGPSPDSLRWHYILRDGVHRWVRYPRDVLRLANAAKFSWPALKGEIDPQDLLAMEGLRLFDPIAFDWVRWNRDFLFTEGRFVMSQDDVREATVKGLKDRLPVVIRDEVLHILSVLFPSQSKWFEGKNTMFEEGHAEVRKRRGIGCEAGYDSYFGLHPSSDAIPKAVIDSVMEKLADEEALVAAIEPLIGKKDRRGQPMIGQLLEELRFRFHGRDHAAPTQEMLDALFRVGEPILGLEWRPDIFALSPRSQISFLIVELLKLWEPEEGGSHLKAAFEKSNSPAFCADIFVDRARELGEIAADSRSAPLIGMDDLKALGDKLLQLIERAAEDGTLANAPFYWDIARSWKHIGDAGKAKAWISAGINASAEFLAKVTMGLVRFSTSTPERVYQMNERPDEELYDLNALLAACKKHLAGNDLTQDQRNRVGAVARDVERMLTG